jgi:pyruvate dehydrogenase E1 component beta subunit
MTVTTETWTYREAIREAIADEMRSDPRVLLLGEDVAAAGGVFKVTEGLLEEFGGDRVRDTPISEQAIVGAAIGAAMLGYKPVVEIMFADFAGVCFDQIANQLAKHSFLTGGELQLSVTVRLANGAGVGFGAQHSQAVENWFLGQSGLKICVPSSAASAYGLLRSAIQDPEPVLVFEPKALYGVPETRVPATTTPLGRAAIIRPGQHVTVVATQSALWRVLEAADELEQAGVDVEVVDPRTLRPMDTGTITESVKKTGRLVCVQEGERAGSWGEHVIACVIQSAFHFLDAQPLLVSSPPIPVPFARHLEEMWMPDTSTIVDKVMEVARS